MFASRWYLMWVIGMCDGFALKQTAPWNSYHFHTYPHPAEKQDHPVDIMVDVVNDLGLRILAVHNEYNENNIAFSPYGALSVLVALGEGLQGEAVREIQQCARIPNDISVIRVGLRDIHRHLKSYFIPKEGFLAGLTLNHDNVTLRPEYGEILKFYGYDVMTFNNGLYPEIHPTERPVTITSYTPERGISTTENLSRTTEPVTEIIITTKFPEETTTPIIDIRHQEEITEGPTTLDTTTALDKVTTALPRTTRDIPTTTAVVTTVVSSTTLSTVLPVKTSTNLPFVVEKTTTILPLTTPAPTLPETSTVSEGTTITKPVPTSPPALPDTTIPEKITSTNHPTLTPLSVSTETIHENITTTNQPSSLLTESSTIPEKTTSVDALITTTQSTSLTTEQITTLEVTTVPMKDNEIIPEESDGFAGTVKRNTNQKDVVELNIVNKQRKARSVVDYLIAKQFDDFYIPGSNRRSYTPREQLGFLMYGKYKEYQINFMKYDAVLPFYYVPHLDTLALSFPLDNVNYYLLLLLPADETGIDQLVCDLRLNESLKYIIKNLRYTHISATIPSFTLKGYVNLTPSLQKLGIQRIFEPRQADFTPMTGQRDIYVTNIEQAITVNIKNYVNPSSLNDYRDLRKYDPVEFTVNHPFLYFVLDSELHVTLMAGKVLNPLNTRIR